MKSNLENAAKKNNVIIGWCKAEVFHELKGKLENIRVPFVKYTIEERTDPFITMENVKTIITIGLSYNKTAQKPNDGKLRAAVSVGAVGVDYHKKLMYIMEDICNSALQGYENMCFTDTGPMCDRYLAYKSGLGFYGKHGNIINPQIGSMFFIGYIFTNAELESYMTPVQGSCHNCGKCIEMCPGGAITEEGFDYKKCVSYLTQSKEDPDLYQRKAMGIQLYGCDVCQRVCPYNKDFEQSEEEVYPDIEEILSLSNKEFKEKYGNTAMGWRGKKIIQRNARIALENIEKGYYNDCKQ